MLKERIPNINDVDLEDDDVLKQLIADCQVDDFQGLNFMLHIKSYEKLWQQRKKWTLQAFSYLLTKFRIQLMKKRYNFRRLKALKIKVFKKCASKMIYFYEKKIRIIFDTEN